MTRSVRVLAAAGRRIDEIYRFGRTRWGEAQAQAYIRGLFAHIEDLAADRRPWRPIPAEFGVAGHFSRYRSHIVFWRVLGDGSLGVVSVLHERMDVGNRLLEDDAP